MKKISTLLLLFIGLTVLSGCNQRKGTIEKYSMDGVYELAFLIDSNLNVTGTAYDPFVNFDRYALEINGTSIKTIIRNKHSQSVEVIEYEINQVNDYYFTIRKDNIYMSDVFYYDIYSGLIEIRVVSTTIQHYVFSKFEDFETHQIPNGTYELINASGYHHGQTIYPQMYQYYNFYIDGNRISYKNKHADGSTYQGSGTYIAGLSGIQTLLANTKEYLNYDPRNKTLTFEYKRTSFDASTSSNFILVFEIKS